MAAQVRSMITPIAQAIKARLMTLLGFPDERVVWTAKARLPEFQADQIVFLRMRRMTNNDPSYDGAGRFNAVVERILDVAPRVRFDVSSTDDEAWLYDPDFGYFALEAKVLDCLIGFFPTDASSNIRVAYELHLISATEASKYPDSPGWGDAMLSFRIAHNLDLDLTLSQT